MQYLNPIYIIPHLFGHKIQIPLTNYLFCKKKFLWVIYFLNHNAHTSPLFRELNILKFPDKISLKNCLFIDRSFNKCLPAIFKNWFTLSSDVHTYNTCWSNLGCIVAPPISNMEGTQPILALSTHGIIYRN